MNAQSPFIGIDFGTSTSKVAWYNPKTNQAEIIMNSDGEPETPSVVYYGENETLVGSHALEMLDYEKERERVIFSIKRELVTTPLLAIAEKSIKPVEIATEILRKLKRDAEERHFYRQITRVVVTYPASFGPQERDKIREATRFAGFTEVEMLEEPAAAAMAYAQIGLKVGTSMLVYDLGGGTFDLAVLNAEDDGAFRLALEPQGIKRCGGDDFDEALYTHCDDRAREKLGRPISLTGKRDLHFLQQCRQRKENLSTTERRLFKSYLEPGPVLFQYELDRATLEALIRPIVEETVRKTKMLLEQANAEGQTVDTMILIGGSSRVPLVKRLLEQSMPLKPLQWQYQDVAVALGAAYHAHSKWGGSGETLEQKRQPAKETSPLIQASSQSDSPPPAQMEATPASTTPVSVATPPVMEQCQACGAKLQPGGAFCTQCGHQLLQAANTLQTSSSLPQPSSLAEKQAPPSPKDTSARRKADAASEVQAEEPSTAPSRFTTKNKEFVLVNTLTGHSQAVKSIAISPDGQTLVSGSDDKTIKVWKLHNGELLRTLTEHSGSVLSVAISPDGQTLVSGSGDKTIKVWNLHSRELLRSFQDVSVFSWLPDPYTSHSQAVTSIAISPDGQILVSGSADKTIKVWNLHSGKLLDTLSGHSITVHSVAISPDGQTLVSGSEDKTIKVWNLHSRELLRPLTDHSFLEKVFVFGGVHSVAISLDGQTLVSGGGTGRIKVWNLYSRELLRTLTAHSFFEEVLSVAISPDGQTLVSGSGDKTIKVWKLHSGELLRTLTDHSSTVFSVAISPDGQTLVSGSGDKTIKVWSKK